MKKVLVGILALIMVLGLVGCSNEKQENYEKAIAYAEEGDFMLAVELMEKALDYKDSNELLLEYKYAYAIHLLGFRDQFDYPSIQNKTNLTLLSEMFGMSEEYYENYKKAYTLLEELQKSGYGKNVDYLLEITGNALAKGVTK